jgi:transcriptional regulator with XRE-family HTH domain
VNSVKEMSRDRTSARAEVLRILLTERRKAARMTQAQVAEKLSWHQSAVASIEAGQRRIDVLEFLRLADALGFDPDKLLKTVRTVPDD